jgi:hypothetical protein
MSVNKKDYRVVEVQDGYTTKYTVKKRTFWLFWKTIKNNAGFDMQYDTKRAAQSYINFLK